MAENEKDITDRFKKLFSILELNPAEFSSEIGLNNNATISRIVAGKVKPSYEIINKILIRYPNVNGNWLLSGIGYSV